MKKILILFLALLLLPLTGCAGVRQGTAPMLRPSSEIPASNTFERVAEGKELLCTVESREQAEEDRLNYAAAMEAVKQTSDQIIADAARTAEHRGNEIISEAREKANDIRRQAEADALLEKKKAEDDMKREIADVSAQLTGKLLEREINAEDHRSLIDSFLQEIGHDDDK